VGIRASGTVTGERESRTWDSLLLTPLDTWEIVIDKQMGTVESFYPMLFVFAVPVVVFAAIQGLAAFWYVAFMLFLTWVAMCYMAATGTWCSVSSTSSWRSLVATLATGYGHLLAILTLVAIASMASSCVLVPLAWLLLASLPIGSIFDALTLAFCSVSVSFMAWRLYRAAQIKLFRARNCVDNEERYGRTLFRVLTRALRKQYERDGPSTAELNPAIGQNMLRE
jgi:hypothetical protein